MKAGARPRRGARPKGDVRAHKLAAHVELEHGRPVRKAFDAGAYCRVLEDVHLTAAETSQAAATRD